MVASKLPEYCDYCPHAKFLHSPTGDCPCGLSCGLKNAPKLEPRTRLHVVADHTRTPEVGDIILVHDTEDLPPKAAIVESPPDEHGTFRIVVINWAYGKEGGTYRGIAYVSKYGERWTFKNEAA